MSGERILVENPQQVYHQLTIARNRDVLLLLSAGLSLLDKLQLDSTSAIQSGLTGRDRNGNRRTFRRISKIVKRLRMQLEEEGQGNWVSPVDAALALELVEAFRKKKPSRPHYETYVERAKKERGD